MYRKRKFLQIASLDFLEKLVKFFSLIINKYIFLFLFLAAISIIFFGWNKMIVYPDEIAFRIWNTRGVADFWTRANIFSQCASENFIKIPLIFYPSAYLLSLISLMKSHVEIRNISMLFLLFSAFFYFSTNGRKTKNNLLNLSLFFLLFSGTHMVSIGMLRPEMFFIVTIFLMLLMYLEGKLSIFYTIVILLLFQISLYVHPKGFFLLPFTLVTLWVTSQNKKIFLSSIFVIFVFTYIWFTDLSGQFLICKEYTNIQSLNQSFNINPIEIFYQPRKFIADIFNQFSYSDYTRIVSLFTFKENGSINYIIPNIEKVRFSWIFNLIYTFLFYYLIFNWIKKLFFIIKDKNFSHHSLIFLSLSFTLCASCLINKVQSFYDVGYWNALLVIISSINLKSKKLKYEDYITKYLFVLSLFGFAISYLLFYTHIRPLYLSGWKYPDFAYGGVLITEEKNRAFKYKQLAEQIKLDSHETHLALDEDSYIYFSDHPFSISVPYSFSVPKEKRLIWYKENISYAIGKCEQLGNLFDASEKQSISHYMFEDVCAFEFKNFK
jgi:hypothetical protein